MIPKPIDILNRFRQSVQDCKDLFYHCINRHETHTDSGIEASFLQFVKSWESFLEDMTLSFLCGEKPITEPPDIIPKFIVSDKEDARTIVYGGKDYTDWITKETLELKFKTYFKVDADNKNRLIDGINSNSTIITNIRKIRNEIAHSSFSTANKIKKIYEDFNPLNTFNRPAEYLKEFSKEDNTKTNFIYLVEMIELNATILIDH